MLDKPPLSNSQTVAIETHGCKLNQADSAVLASDFVEAGYTVVADSEPADVYLVNTCTVTHIADRKARHALRAARRRNPNVTIVATGCYAQRSPEALRSMPEIDLVLGNTDKATLVRQVTEWNGVVLAPSSPGADSPGLGPRTTRTRAAIKIQEGCDQVCAYCIVPKVRGRERSIPPETIVRRVNEQVALGRKEVVLTGTQLGTYGFDLPEIDLAGLLGQILAETDVARVRVSSLQPQEIDATLLGLWSDRRLCPHFHLALQSGSDEVLKRMRRRYTARRYVETVETIRAAVPGASITTDVIVGFPGETESHFSGTYSLCDEVGFAAIHVFPYSARPGTSAAHFGGGVDPETKAGRVRHMVDLSRRGSAEFRQPFLGTVRPVLWEGPSGGESSGVWTGLTDNYIRVVGRSHRELSNEIIPARLLRQQGDLVFGQVPG